MGYGVTPFGAIATKLFQQTDRADCVNLSSEKLRYSKQSSHVLQLVKNGSSQSKRFSLRYGRDNLGRGRSPNSIHFAQQSSTAATYGRLTTTRSTVSHSKSGLELCKRPNATPPRLAVDARPGHHRPLCLDSRVQSTFYQSVLTNSAMSFQRLFSS